jgi:hypothetical protein
MLPFSPGEKVAVRPDEGEPFLAGLARPGA